jgi:hypothetical protein
MNEDEAQRLRDAIARDQTRCRCGHLLAACADCRDWLIEHSPRITVNWRAWFVVAILQQREYKHVWGADAAEADDLAYFEAGGYGFRGAR